MDAPSLLLAGSASLAAGRALVPGRFACSGQGRRVAGSVCRAMWVNAMWRRTARQLGLTQIRHAIAGETLVASSRKSKPPKVMTPLLYARGDAFGVVAEVRTVGRIGLAEFQRATPYLADRWRCVRVEVSQSRPGWLRVRGLLRDPLEVPFDCPLTGEPLPAWSLMVGRDMWGRVVMLPLRNLSGVKIGGMPGYGKTFLMLGLFGQLAPSPAVQFAVFDGKTRDVANGDWGEVLPRAYLAVGDDIHEANAGLGRLVDEIKTRPDRLRRARDTNKFWKHGPTPDIPLIVAIIDESRNYTDKEGLSKADLDVVAENARHLKTLVKEGRGLGLLVFVITQKQTGDAIPTAARDNLEVGICFAVSTIEAAEAALGSGIRQDGDNQPTRLRDKSRFVGVATATGLPGVPGYTRLRGPNVDEHQVARIVQEFAHLTRDPSEIDTVLAA